MGVKKWNLPHNKKDKYNIKAADCLGHWQTSQ